jgi:quercetin dioxygenase-like cupin family protein
MKLPEELEEQSMLHALGVLDPEGRQAFLGRLQGESDLLRQAARTYQATTDVLAYAVAPVMPPSSLRERLVNRVALEAARETEQFELAANTLALGVVPIKPRHSVRERLLSQIDMHADVRVDLREPAPVLAETSTQKGNGLVGEGQSPVFPEDISLAGLLRSCRTAVANLLRMLVIRSMTSERVRYWKAKIAFQQPTKGLTFIGASEGTWRGIAPGVTAKVLSFDPVSCRTTTLLRFASGASYAPHRHTTVEELLVLEGGCRIAGHEMTVGDYHRAEAGTEHYDTSTDEGCLLLVISSPHNEMLSSRHP